MLKDEFIESIMPSRKKIDRLLRDIMSDCNLFNLNYQHIELNLKPSMYLSNGIGCQALHHFTFADKDDAKNIIKNYVRTTEIRTITKHAECKFFWGEQDQYVGMDNIPVIKLNDNLRIYVRINPDYLYINCSLWFYVVDAPWNVSGAMHKRKFYKISDDLHICTLLREYVANDFTILIIILIDNNTNNPVSGMKYYLYSDST